MNRKEYLKKLEEIKSMILDENAESKKEEIRIELEKLYQYKPVLLDWYLVRAMYSRVLAKDLNMANQYLEYLANNRLSDEYIISYLNEKRLLAKTRNTVFEVQRFEKKKNAILQGRTSGVNNMHLKYICENLKKANCVNDSVKEILEEFYINSDFCMYILLYEIFTKEISCNMNVHKWVRGYANLGIIEELVRGKDKFQVAVLSVGQSNKVYMDVVECALRRNGHNVCRIHTEKIDGKFMQKINEYIKKVRFSYVFAIGAVLDKCVLENNEVERMSAWQGDYFENTLAFGWMGDYMTYISHLYKMDAYEGLKSEDNVEFSIVIPVRNNSYCLKETIKTCLEQRFKGTYEIVISDNSTTGNNDIREYIQNLNDTKVRYYRTPREFPLAKSFEYAVLRSRGKFVIPIGADDALLPWTLEVLNEVLEECPGVEVIEWDRGFYAWPGFNEQQENQFVIPGKYDKGNIVVEEKDNIQAIFRILQGECEDVMYALPNLYINSGFKREYLSVLLENTGRLWDGICQDLYMGIITSAVCENILYIRYPLAIAGMSSNSVGAKSNSGVTEIKKANDYNQENRLIGNVGGWTASYMERLLPYTGSDIYSTYVCILRAIQRNIFPREWIDDTINWEKWYINITSKLNPKDVFFSQKLENIRWSAWLLGRDYGEWFDEISNQLLEPQELNVVNNELKKGTKYVEGVGKNGSIILDASKYGVHNSYEASKLFEKLTEL